MSSKSYDIQFLRKRQQVVDGFFFCLSNKFHNHFKTIEYIFLFVVRLFLFTQCSLIRFSSMPLKNTKRNLKTTHTKRSNSSVDSIYPKKNEQQQTKFLKFLN